MNEHVLALVISNLVIAVALAMFAFAVQARARRPWLAHVAWLMVLVKLVTPSMVSVPVLVIDAEPVDAPAVSPAPSSDDAWQAPAFELSSTREAARPSPEPFAVAMTSVRAHGLAVLAWIWVVGSTLVFCVSSMRIVRFEHRLRHASKEADPQIVAMATRVSKRVGLRRTPKIRVVQADVAPLVWWSGGVARVVLPTSMVARLSSNALRVVVAHELAHIARGDHLVRWVEWLANVLFWWCPVLWIARRGLRRAEELSCDALVVERLGVTPHSYASSILDAIELLAAPAIRPPVLASQMTSGGALEERLTMIVSNPTHPSPSRRARVFALLVAAIVLPFGIAHAQDPDYDAVGNRLMKAVDSGELSVAQAKAMFGALAAQHFEEALAARNQEARETGSGVTQGMGRSGLLPTDATTESDPFVKYSESGLDDVTNEERDARLRSYEMGLRFVESPLDRDPGSTGDTKAYDKYHTNSLRRGWLNALRDAADRDASSAPLDEEDSDLPQQKKKDPERIYHLNRGQGRTGPWLEDLTDPSTDSGIELLDETTEDLSGLLRAWGRTSKRDADYRRALLNRFLGELEAGGADDSLVERVRAEIGLTGESDPEAVGPVDPESAGGIYGHEALGDRRR